MRTVDCELFYLPSNEELRYLPEGPLLLRNFPSPDPVLGWVAIQHAPDATVGSINLLNLRTLSNDHHPLPGRPGFFAETDEPGVAVIGLERSLVLYSFLERRLLGPTVAVTPDERVSINDGVAVKGGLLFGTKHLTFTEKVACLYWYDAAGRRLHVLQTGMICDNGKFLYEENRELRLLDIDSFRKTLDRYAIEFSTPAVRGPEIVADFRETPLYPDGMRPLPGGRSVVVAFYNPEKADTGAARQFRVSDGAVEAEWRVPGSPRVTCPEFVRIDGGVKLLLTTAVEGMAADIRAVAPNAGGFFLGETDLTELPSGPVLFPASAL
jgi:sugar lactone lactonase YvrE